MTQTKDYTQHRVKTAHAYIYACMEYNVFGANFGTWFGRSHLTDVFLTYIYIHIYVYIHISMHIYVYANIHICTQCKQDAGSNAEATSRSGRSMMPPPGLLLETACLVSTSMHEQTQNTLYMCIYTYMYIYIYVYIKFIYNIHIYIYCFFCFVSVFYIYIHIHIYVYILFAIYIYICFSFFNISDV